MVARHGATSHRVHVEISHGSCVKFPAPCLVHIAACGCACPVSQAPPALRALCRGWIQRACTGWQAPVQPPDISLGYWVASPVSRFLLSESFESGSKPLCMIISGKHPSRSSCCLCRAPSRIFRIACMTVGANVMIFCRKTCPAACFFACRVSNNTQKC